jgi:hypothetical protein
VSSTYLSADCCFSELNLSISRLLFQWTQLIYQWTVVSGSSPKIYHNRCEHANNCTTDVLQYLKVIMKSFKKPKEVTKSSTSNTMVKRKKCEKTNNNPKELNLSISGLVSVSSIYLSVDCCFSELNLSISGLLFQWAQLIYQQTVVSVRSTYLSVDCCFRKLNLSISGLLFQ